MAFHIRPWALAPVTLTVGVLGAFTAAPALAQGPSSFSGSCTDLSGAVTFGPHFSFVPSMTSISFTLTGGCTGTVNGVKLNDQYSSLNLNAAGTMGCGGSASVGLDGSLTIYAASGTIYLPFKGGYALKTPNFTFKANGTVGGSVSGDGSLLGPGTNIVAMSPAAAGCVAGGAKHSMSSGRLFASGLLVKSTSSGSSSPSSTTSVPPAKPKPKKPRKPRKHAKKHKR